MGSRRKPSGPGESSTMDEEIANRRNGRPLFADGTF